MLVEDGEGARTLGTGLAQFPLDKRAMARSKKAARKKKAKASSAAGGGMEVEVSPCARHLISRSPGGDSTLQHTHRILVLLDNH